MLKGLAILLLAPLAACAMVVEHGSLHGFLFDTCSTCAYDNWLSHVSERVVRPDYNDYGPPNLDPVTNGFGGFTYIPANADGDSTLARWRRMFDYAVAREWSSADSMLALYDTEWNYELVRLYEWDRRQEYYIIRERLDSSYVDANGDTLPENDVIGGFGKAWGVFIFNPTPRHPFAVVEVPHPEDDYMAPPVAADLFVRGEFAVMMIAGAGREVMWDTTFSTYTNERSVSDPSRNGRQPFQMLHEALVDAWDAPPVSSFIVFQIHSYDHNEHAALGDLQMSCFFDDHYPNLPIRDVGRHRDFIHALPRFPVTQIDGDTTIATRVDEYVSLWSLPPYNYFSVDTLPIRNITDYLGAPSNQQGNYCHEEHDPFRHTENFVHIELDEYPDALWTPTDFLRWLPGSPPARLSNFRVLREYYAPLVAAIDTALTWHELPDTTAPATVRITAVLRINPTTAEVRWNQPAYDQHFDTYELFFDTTTITETSPVRTRTNPSYTSLGDQTTRFQRVFSLTEPLERYRFAIRSRDILGHISAMSPEWGIIDSTIDNLTMFYDGDSLRLSWSGAYYDSLYEVREYLPDYQNYYYIGTTDMTSYTFVPTERGTGRVSVVMIKRVLKD
ncbi:hypothetical protein HUU59_07950 [bacterium]|nr:hypothetical protein [bacterium]